MQNGEFVTCKMCGQIFLNEYLPECEQNYCPECCSCCEESGACDGLCSCGRL